jgi:penicillin G amidase
VQLLLQWDCALRADSPEAAVYEFWAGELRSAVTARVVPAEAQKIFGKLPLLRVVRELSNPQNALFGSDPQAARDAMLFATLDAARLKLIARQGPDIKEWTWGQLHRIKFQHPLDSAPGAAALFDRGPMKRSGDGEVVQATAFRDDSFDQLIGASYREIFDLADWDRSVAINVPGQSGQPGSKHYDDLLPLWIEGKYFPLSFTKGAVDAVTTDVLYLTPAHR